MIQAAVGPVGKRVSHPERRGAMEEKNSLEHQDIIGRLHKSTKVRGLVFQPSDVSVNLGEKFAH